MAKQRTLKSGILRERFPQGEIRETELGKIAPQAYDRFPFYFLLPYDDPIALLQWRIYVRKRCIADLQFRDQVWEAARRDAAFFLVTFGSLYEPRPPFPRWLPFHLWKDQVSVLAWLEEIYGVRDACLTGDTLVVTRRGNVPIRDVTIEDEVWDGEAWVQHGGCEFRGDQEVIDAYGVRMTPDHKVMTTEGWQRADKRVDRAEVRLPDSYRGASRTHREMPVRLRRRADGSGAGLVEVHAQRRLAGLRPDLPDQESSRHGGLSTLSNVEIHETAMPEPQNRSLQILRRARDSGVRAVDGLRELLGGHAGGIRRSPRTRSDRQRRQLLSRELPLGFASREHGESRQQILPVHSHQPRPDDDRRRSPYRWSERSHTTQPRSRRVGAGRDTEPQSRNRATPNPAPPRLQDREVPVYDLINSGPRHRFTVIGRDGRPLLVHNCVDKTRGIGMSWLVAGFIFHKWVFTDCTIAVMTKDLSLLDDATANTLLGKFQYLFDHLPAWAKFTRSGSPLMKRLAGDNMLINVESAATIRGYPSTSMKVRQLRFTMVFGDEFAFYDRTDQDEWMTSVGGTTNCRLLVSTWNGFDDMFHYLSQEDESSMLKIRTFWWNNEERWAGAYKMVSGRVIFVDKNYKHPVGYAFGDPDIIEAGLLRSPWVDAEMERPNRDPLVTLRDLYGMKVCEQTNAFFERKYREAVQEMIREPETQGTIDMTGERLRIIPSAKSDIRLWGGVPEADRGPYVLGCDLAQGADKAHSVASVIDSGGEQVLEFGTNELQITEFAYVVVLIARWLAGDKGDGYVLIDFEANGQQSQPFGAELERLQYGNVWRSKRINKPRRGEAPTYLGTVNRDAGTNNFETLKQAVMDLSLIIKSERVLNDMKRAGIDREKGGRPKLPQGKDGHGDYLYALALAWWRARVNASPENRGMVQSELEQKLAKNQWESSDFRLWSEPWKAA